MRFSASGLKKYQDCPLQFKFSHILRIPEPPGASPAAAKGSSIHSVIENLDLTQPTQEQVARLFEQYWTPEQFESVTQSEQDKTSACDLIETYLAWQNANHNTKIGSEKEFCFTFAGREMHGYIDRIEQAPSGEYVVIDFKSGSSKSSGITKKSIPENIQLNLYAMAIRALYGKLPERASLFYLKDNKLIDYLPTDESITAFSQSLEQMIGKILSGEFPAQPDYQRCGWCPYVDLCESRELEAVGDFTSSCL
jgi:DNA helicase-2/ATP-dependent DNA helicase PcrA